MEEELHNCISIYNKGKFSLFSILMRSEGHVACSLYDSPCLCLARCEAKGVVVR